MKLRNVLVVLLVAGLASACSEGSSSGGKADAAADAASATTTDGPMVDGRVAEAGGGSIPLDQLGVRYIESICTKVFMCCPADIRAQEPSVGKNVEQCQFQLEPIGLLLVEALTEGVSTGKMAYDPVKMAACLAEKARLSCAEARTPTIGPSTLPSCKAAFHGTVTLGGDCESDGVCLEGWCDRTLGGKCVPLLADGQPCADSSECLSRVCNIDTRQCVPDTVDEVCGF